MPDLNVIYAKMLEWAAKGRRAIKIEISTQTNYSHKQDTNYSHKQDTDPHFHIHCYDFDLEAGCVLKDWVEFSPETIENNIRAQLNFDLERVQRKLNAMKETAAPEVAQ